MREKEEGKEKRKCEAIVVQENESDEQKVDQDVMSEVRDELTGATNLSGRIDRWFVEDVLRDGITKRQS